MKKTNKNETIGNRILYFVIGMLVFFGYYYLLPGLYHSSFKKYVINSSLVVQNLAMALVEIVIFTFVFLCYRKRIVEDFKKFKKDYKKNLDIGFKNYFIGLLIMAISNILISLLVGGIAANESQNREILKLYPLFSVVSMIILGPMIEELIFRLGFRKAFKNWLPFAIFSALFFGGLHVYTAFEGMNLTEVLHHWKNMLYIIPYGSLGFVFAKAYYESDNIWTTITIHTLHNAVTILLIFASMR